MALAATISTLANALRDIGRGVVFYEVGAYAGSGTDVAFTHLGDTEGEIAVEANGELSMLTLPELSGPVPHQAYLDGVAPIVTIPLFSAAPAIKAIANPLGSGSFGTDVRTAVTEYFLAIIPEAVFIEAGARVALGYTTAGDWTVGGDAATAAQLALLDKSIFFWRGFFEPLMPKYVHDDAGKEVQEVRFVAMHNSAMPAGHQVCTLGRPDQASTAIELSAT